MAITPNNYSFSGGAFMGGSGSPVTPEDIHTLNLSKNGESIGNYNPLVGDATIDIPSDAFVCYYNSTTAAQIHEARQSGKAPYLYINGIIVPLWKIETGKFTFRTTSTREVDGDTYLDIVDYVVEGLAWSTETHTVSGNGGSQQAYLKKVSSLAVFDTTGHSGMETVAYVNDVPVDGVYKVSVMLSVTPKTASPTKSDLVFQFTGTSGTGMPNTTFHAVVDDSQTFAQQLSFSTTLNLKAGTNSLKMACGELNTQYLAFVDDLTVAQIVNGSSSGGGGTVVAGTIYPSLQEAIADAANLSVGNLFETNGFHTSGDGGAARYLVSDTGTANGKNIVQLGAGKLAILQYIDFVKPEQYGAYGNNSTDDTDAFDAMFSDANAKIMVLSENKTYKIQFKNWTFSNRTLVGLNKDSSRISQVSSNLNTPFLTPGTDCDIGNMTIICGGGNTSRTGLFHFGDNAAGVFTPYIGTRIHDVHAYCIANIIGVDISYTSSGSYNLKIEHCKFDNPGSGIRISMLGDTTHQSYISDFYFEDILVSGPYSYGLEMDKAQAGGMMISHGLISQFSVQLQRNGSCGFKLSYGDYVLVNPTAFIENTSGEVYSLNLDFQKQYPGNLQNGIITCVGGILEGQIINKSFLNLISWEKTDFVEESDFNENTAGIRPVSRHLSTSPNSVYHKSAQQIQKNSLLTNASLDLVNNDFGEAVKISVSDFSASTSVIDIPIELPSSNYITIQALLLYSNNYMINEVSGGFPAISLVDSNENILNDLFGLSLANRYGRITMDAYKRYYGLSSRFDLTNADRAATWKIRLVLPTGFSDAAENAFISLLALNVFDGIAALPNLAIDCVRNKEWSDKDTSVISQVIQGGTSGQWLTFTFPQLKFNSMAYLSFTAKNIAVTDDEAILIKIMSGETVLREYHQILKAGLNTLEVSISAGGKSYTPKLSLTSPNQKFISGTYTCYIQGIAL
jgi:hypothetical protein